MPEHAELLLATDKLFHASIVSGVVKDAVVALKAERYRAAVILTYSGIDTMASLIRDAQKAEVQRSDFIEWSERYLRFPEGDHPSGIELYGARCGLLHANMAESRLSEGGRARLIGYVDVADRAVLIDENVPDVILISVSHLVGIFAEGVLSCWKDIKQAPERLALVHDRLKKLFAEYSANNWQPS